MAIDAKTGDLHLGVQAQVAARASTAATNRNMAIWGNDVIDAGADD